MRRRIIFCTIPLLALAWAFQTWTPSPTGPMKSAAVATPSILQSFAQTGTGATCNLTSVTAGSTIVVVQEFAAATGSGTFSGGGNTYSTALLGDVHNSNGWTLTTGIATGVASGTYNVTPANDQGKTTWRVVCAEVSASTAVGTGSSGVGTGTTADSGTWTGANGALAFGAGFALTAVSAGSGYTQTVRSADTLMLLESKTLSGSSVSATAGIAMSGDWTMIGLTLQ